MLNHMLPVCICLLMWWIGTGIVLRLSGQSEQSFNRGVVIFSLVALAAVIIVVLLLGTTTVWSAYVSFTAAIVIWGWLEFMHYSGYLVGPRTQTCPSNLTTKRRFFLALHAMLYHEIALAVSGIGLLIITWGSPNKTALYTFLVLWIMRVSAELNVFFGVAFLPEEWLPEKLRYLMSYRKKKRINLMFPVSVSLATAVCFWMFLHLPSAATDAFSHASMVLTASLLALAIVEHWLLVIPVKSTSLWSWAHGSSAA